jgi:PAS domain S-box-containing protein
MSLNKSIGELLGADDVFSELFRKNPSKKLLISVDTGQIIDASDAALTFYGYSHAEITNKNINEINILAADEIINMMINTKELGAEIFRFKHRLANGNIKDVEVSTSIVKLYGREYFYSHVSDITDILISQERLRYGEQLFLQFVTKTPVALAMFDNDMNYLLISQKWAENFDFEPQDRLGKNYYDVFPNQPEHWKNAHQLAMNGQPQRMEDEIYFNPNGDTEWLRWEAINWFKEQDEIGGIIIFKEIITSRKKADEIRASLMEQRMRMAIKVEAVEEDRRNISRELHDGLGQLLTAAHLNIELVEQHLKNSPNRALDDLNRTKSLITRTIHEVRNIAQNLRPAVLDDLGLASALRNLCEEFNQTESLAVRFDEYGLRGPYRPSVEIALYRICQEALSNIAKHAGASEAEIEVYDRETHLLAVIQDNGEGFDVMKMLHIKSGSGLLNIKERAELVGGNIQIDSKEHRGTELIVEIPIQETNNLFDHE